MRRKQGIQYIYTHVFSEWDLCYSYICSLLFLKANTCSVCFCMLTGVVMFFFLQDVLCWQSLQSVGIVGYQQQNYLVVSNIFYFHPFLGRWSNLTNIFQMGWNHQLENHWNYHGIPVARAGDFRHESKFSPHFQRRLGSMTRRRVQIHCLLQGMGIVVSLEIIRLSLRAYQRPRSLLVWVVVSNIFYFHPYLGKISHFD